MICPPKPRTPFTSVTPRRARPNPPPLSRHLPLLISSSHHEHRGRILPLGNPHLLKPLLNPTQKPPSPIKQPSSSISSQVGSQMWAPCGFGYWVQGFRCFPWLALNFQMVHALSLSPSTLQLVQHIANLPMVAKPLFGVISDAIYIRGAHRLPYISIGVFIQVLSWGALALIPVTREALPLQMACILLSNLGASVTEVVSAALVAEFSRTQKESELQSHVFIALAVGSLLGNLSGGFVLQNTGDTKILFSVFALLLTIQLGLSLTTKETLICSRSSPSHHLVRNSVSENVNKQFSSLMTAISEESILYPLSWVVASVAIVPTLSGSVFCFQTRFLNLDHSIIGLSRVIGQIMVLTATVFYNRYLIRIPMRKLMSGVQILYALSLLSDLFLVKQINLKLGVSNEIYVLCLSASAEAVAQFKILPFAVLFSNLCPSGCEGSLFAFFASALCLSSILSGVFGVGLASLIGVSTGDYSSLPLGIGVQFVAALVPLGWISYLPVPPTVEMMKKG